MAELLASTFFLFLFLAVIFLLTGLRIVSEYDRLVVFRLGRYVGERGPGIVYIIPFIERAEKVDTRVITLEVPTQETLTRDNIPIKVNAVVYYRIINPGRAVVMVMDPHHATFQLAQTTLRSVVGQSDLDELLAHREAVNSRLREIIDEGTEPWGVKVSTVEIRDIELPAGMQRAIAAQAEAERERRAKIILADGEYQAANRLVDAARLISQDPNAITLRYLQTLREIASERSTVIVFPINLEAALQGILGQMRSASSPPSAPAEGEPPIRPE
ncbi:MAG: slipin family protein [Brockia lithotrophica]|nr:slipin family protein [Brockia lithotrophica]